MIGRLLPRQADNYRGSRIALWIFGTVVALRTIISVNSMLMARDIASTADGIPLDTYSPGAAQTIVSLFALLGLSGLALCIVNIIVLARYRGLVPLMFGLMLLQTAGRRLIHHFIPTGNEARPASIISVVFLTLMVAGLLLSLRTGNDQTKHA